HVALGGEIQKIEMAMAVDQHQGLSIIPSRRWSKKTACIAAVRASRRALRTLLSMRQPSDAIKEKPYPQEAGTVAFSKEPANPPQHSYPPSPLSLFDEAWEDCFRLRQWGSRGERRRRESSEIARALGHCQLVEQLAGGARHERLRQDCQMP